MKKFISLMVVAILVLSMFAGCGKTTGSVTTDGSTSILKSHFRGECSSFRCKIVLFMPVSEWSTTR